MNRSGVEPKKQTAKFVYDFSKHGGAQGDISVQGDGIPAGAIIDKSLIHVETAPVGSGATVAIRAQASEDILAATAITGMTLNALLDGLPDGTAANAIRLTSAINALTFTIAAADLTAGMVAVALEYH